MALSNEENKTVENTQAGNTGIVQGNTMRKGDFIQYAGIPVIGLMVYTGTNNLLMALMFVLVLYLNAVMVVGSMRLLKSRCTLLDGLIVVNLSFVALAVALFSIGFAFDRSDFEGIELWKFSLFFYGAWFLIQVYFAKRIIKSAWGMVFAGVLVALLGTGALIFVFVRTVGFMLLNFSALS